MRFDRLPTRTQHGLDPMATTVMLATLLLVTTVASGEATYRLQCPSDDVDRAIRDCTIVIGSRRTSLRAAYETRCVALWLKGAYARAIPDCDQSIRIGVSSPAAYLLSGIALAERGDHHGAVAYYSRSIELTPTTTAYYNRGTSYLVLGEYVWALEDFDRAIAGQPSVRQARINRAVALLIDGREKEEIRAELDRATEFISLSATASAIKKEVLEFLSQRSRPQGLTALTAANVAPQIFPPSKVLPEAISLESLPRQSSRPRIRDTATNNATEIVQAQPATQMEQDHRCR